MEVWGMQFFNLNVFFECRNDTTRRVEIGLTISEKNGKDIFVFVADLFEQFQTDP